MVSLYGLGRLLTLLLAAAFIYGCDAPEADAPKRAKNVILFVGDGMGVSTVTAMRIYAGQKEGKSGEEHVLPFETFDHLALIKTYNTNQQVPDSAGTATAMHSGVKTRSAVLNVAPTVGRGNCKQGLEAPLVPFTRRLSQKGIAVGIVTTSRLTHATPASAYATSPDRNWEDDSDVSEPAKTLGCKDIASQLLEFPFDLAWGGGRANFEAKAAGGRRIDPTDILGTWERKTGGSVSRTFEDLRSAPADAPSLGLLATNHMTFELDRTPDTLEPTLSDLTAMAIDRLSARPGGYYLLVEGGRIDHAHHYGKAGYALEEGYAFAQAVQIAMEKTDAQDTLILVTADHSHVFTIGGYPTRGNPILGHVVSNDARGEPLTEPALALDGLPYTTLGYHNGRGAVTGTRSLPETGVTASQQAVIPLGAETHGGEDVALYAQGPGADAVKGVMEQNEIYSVIMSAFGQSD